MIVNVTAAEYHARKAISMTLIKRAIAGAPVLRSFLAGDDTPAPCSVAHEGTTIHALVLNPDEFDDEIAICPEYNLKRKADREDLERFAEINAGRAIVRPSQLERCKRAADAVRSHPYVRDLLEAPSAMRETSMFWTDDAGRDRKSRVDLYVDGLVIDLKTCDDASPATWSRKLFADLVDVQLTGYGDAFVSHGLPFDAGAEVVAVERGKAGRYGVAIHRITASDIEAARDDIRRGLEVLDNLPDVAIGYAAQPYTHTRPKWIRR